MTLLQSFSLGFLQGFTEFLPISSSGHLALAEGFFNIPLSADQLEAFDIILHAGTLLALIIYFWPTWKKLLITFFSYPKAKDKESKTLLNTLILALIPVVVVGAIGTECLEYDFRDPKNIAIVMGLTGILFLLVEKFPAKKNITKVSMKSGIFVGFAQILALIPGVSRSGITITAAMAQGITREKAAEFSFLLGAPTILAATTYLGLKLFILDDIAVTLLPGAPEIILGFFTSLIVSLITIHYFLAFVRKYTLKGFAYYLILLSIGALVLL